MEDTADGKETRDMTKAQVIKATFRVLTLKLAKVKIPMLVTNHVYDVVGSYVPMKEIGGGSGLKYAASTIVMLGKKKDKEGTDLVGNIIKVTMHKSRLSKEGKKVEVKLSFEKGLNRFYGLLDLGIKHGVFKQVSTRIELPDGTKQYAKTIYNEPTKYFTEEIMGKLEEAAKKEFMYGAADEELVSDSDVVGED